MNEITTKKIKQNIKREIEQSKCTQAEIARAVGVSPQTINQYCTGRALPSLITFAKLCAFLYVPADSILGIDENK